MNNYREDYYYIIREIIFFLSVDNIFNLITNTFIQDHKILKTWLILYIFYVLKRIFPYSQYIKILLIHLIFRDYSFIIKFLILYYVIWQTILFVILYNRLPVFYVFIRENIQKSFKLVCDIYTYLLNQKFFKILYLYIFVDNFFQKINIVKKIISIIMLNFIFPYIFKNDF